MKTTRTVIIPNLIILPAAILLSLTQVSTHHDDNALVSKENSYLEPIQSLKRLGHLLIKGIHKVIKELDRDD